MKKIISLISLIFIFSIVPLSAMKRTHDQIIASTDATQTEFWLPNDMINRIAASCDPQARMLWSSLNAHFKKLTSIRNTEGDIAIDKADRLYYLFYGCIHNLKNLVINALKTFDLDEKVTHEEKGIVKYTWYPEKEILNNANYYIKQMTQSDTTDSLPYFQDIRVYNTNIFDFIAENDDAALFALCIKNPVWNDKNACGQNWLTNALCYDAFTNEKLAMLKTLLMHKRFDDRLWETPNLAAAQLLIDYDNDINRGDKKGKTLLHKHIPCDHDVYADKYNLPIIIALLNHPNINGNAEDEQGNTPLHNAVLSASLKTTELLLSHSGINIKAKNKQDDTPLTLAIKMLDAESNRIAVSYYYYTHNHYSDADAEQRAKEQYLQVVTTINKNKHAIVAQLLLAQQMIKDVQDYIGKYTQKKI